MRSTSRGRTLVAAFFVALFGALSLTGASALAAGPAPAPPAAGVHAVGDKKPVAARKPAETAAATPASAGKATAAQPAPQAKVSGSSAAPPPPSAGPKVEARRGRGHF